MVKKLLLSLIVIVFAGIVVHAPLSVGFGVLFPEYILLIKSWKEILIAVAAVLLAIHVTRLKKWGIFRHWLLYVSLGYGALHLLLLPFFDTSLQAKFAGLLIDLRYVGFFVLIFGFVRLYPEVRNLLVKVFFAGALLVCLFGVLQVFVLPHDILKYLGYSTDTIAAYMTVDQNMDYIRISSTLRGPNPLGAYAGIALAMLVSLWFALKGTLSAKKNVLFSAGLFIAGIVLWFNYSRSALVAGVFAVALVALLYVIVYARHLLKPLLFSSIGLAVIAGGAVYAFRDTEFVSHVIMHEDPNEGNDINSNDGHAESLKDGTDRMIRQPWGAGIGSTGSASLLGEDGLIIENQYLFVAHEVGWLGLLLFMLLFCGILRELWVYRSDWLARAVFASGIGMALIGLLLPVWVDDTVSIVWWGLAAIALAAPQVKRKKKEAV